jgi:hypothetical protein
MHSWNILSINSLGIFSRIYPGNSWSNFPSICLSICPGICPAILPGIPDAGQEPYRAPGTRSELTLDRVEGVR